MDQRTRTGIVDELSSLLTQGNAHVTLTEACADIPLALLNQPVPDLPYTLWQLAEHLRIAQWDILEFCRNPQHVSPPWPEGYCPGPEETADEARWQTTLRQLEQDRTQFIELLQDTDQDLLSPLPHGTGQTLLREALLIADHNAYHTGQIIFVRRLLNNWK